MATTLVDICNLALSNIGADATITALDGSDTSAEAGYCVRFLPIARREMIELGDWEFAVTRATLAASSSNASLIWSYSYVVPSDCINALRVLRPTATTNGISYTDPFGTLLPMVPSYYIATDESNGATFELEGTTLYTNEADAILKYSKDITDPTLYPNSFVTALAYLMASYLAGPIIKGMPGLQMSSALRDKATKMASVASANMANNSMSVHEFVAASIRART